MVGESEEDLYYNVIPRQVMEKRFPESKRSYIRLKDIELCGADMNVISTRMASSESDIWNRLANSRKNPVKQAALIGFDTLFLLLFRMVTLDEAVQKVTKRLKITGRAIVCPYAEVGMDVDKPHQLEVSRNLENNMIVIRIKDDGIGMEPQICKRAFESFFTTKELGKGTGLGLFISYNLVSELDGTIELDSEPGKGTTVTVKIPIRPKNKLISANGAPEAMASES